MVSDTTPSFACGQMKWPRSNRFIYRHMPLPIVEQAFVQIASAATEDIQCSADNDVLRVSLADKVHNARAILRDLRKPDVGCTDGSANRRQELACSGVP